MRLHNTRNTVLQYGRFQYLHWTFVNTQLATGTFCIEMLNRPRSGRHYRSAGKGCVFFLPGKCFRVGKGQCRNYCARSKQKSTSAAIRRSLRRFCFLFFVAKLIVYAGSFTNAKAVVAAYATRLIHCHCITVDTLRFAGFFTGTTLIA